MSVAIDAFAEATVRTATPLALAAMGELVVERAGIINISLEGIIISGCFGALVGATHVGALGGYVASMACGIAIALVFAAFAVWLRTDQIIAGTAVTLLAVGLTGTLYRALYGPAGAGLSIPTTGPIALPGLSKIPMLGPGFFNQPMVAYVAYLLVPLVWWWMYKTHAGLALRAVGESPDAAQAAGIQVNRMRLGALIVGGAAGGLAGGTLVLAQAGTFAEGMSAGRGFIAIAIVVLGRWHPGGVVIAALLFGAGSALQFLLQAIGVAVPYQFLLALPYLLTLAGLAGLAGRVRAPAGLATEASR
ncbi:MAG: ABC transporter permease [Acidobacteriaceae bacterium]|jgi:simple sugar transport system permease protein|nr:ABC transporter permease [Acidobacteriaceae bacterium]